MKAGAGRYARGVVGFLMTLLLFAGTASMAWAGGADDLLRTVNKDLRQAQRDMFGGKTDKAVAALEPIREKLLQAKQVDPNNSRITTYENKYKKLVKDLERRTGKDLGGGTLTAAGASTQTELAPKPEVKALPQKQASTVPATGAVDDLAKQADSLIRKAERSMFSGKNEDAAAQLGRAASMIAGIQVQDPGHARLETLQNKYAQVEKKLAAKMPKAGSETAPAGRPAAGGEQTADTKLPYHARGPVQNADNDLRRIDSALEKLKDPKWNHDQLMENMGQYLESARQNLEKGRQEAAAKGVDTHPAFDRIAAGIKTAEEKIARAGEDLAQSRAAADASAAEVTADVDALKAAYDQAEPVFAKATGTVIYYNDLEPVNALIDIIEQFEKNDLEPLLQKMQAFGAKYGTTEDAIDAKADAMGYANNYYRASYAYTEIEQGIQNVGKTRTVMADDLVRKAEEMQKRTGDGIHDFARLKQHARIKAWGRMAARFDDQNPRVQTFNDQIDAWIAADAKALDAKIDQAAFPKQAADAPKDAEKLAKEAVVFLQKEEDKDAAKKGKEVSKVLAVVVTGPWRVFKTNILGEPIQYNLPIATAVQTATERKQNLARVYLSTMLTHEMKGVEKAPPYLGATVGDSYYIRPGKVK